VVEADDLFGWAVAAGDFDRDGFTDLGAGAPREDVGSLGEAGAVSVLYGSGGGLTTTGGQLFTQNSAGILAQPNEGTGSAVPPSPSHRKLDVNRRLLRSLGGTVDLSVPL
jgi:hypothetical protein